jgi:hypothetical protein
MTDQREERSDGAAKAAEVHEEHQSSANQVRDEPFPASHDDQRGQPAATRAGAGPAPASAVPSPRAADEADDDEADGDDSADSGRG